MSPLPRNVNRPPAPTSDPKQTDNDRTIAVETLRRKQALTRLEAAVDGWQALLDWLGPERGAR